MAKAQTIENIDVKDNKQVEFVTIDTVPEPDYSYGNENETLDYNLAMRNTPKKDLLLMWA